MEHTKKKVVVVDGQGGGVGASIIDRLKKINVQILALGSNAIATSAMLKAGAKEGATGENAVLFNVPEADIIVGPVGIIMPNGLLGEITPLMAEAIGRAKAKKILIPSFQCNICMALEEQQPMQYYIDNCVKLVQKELQ